MGNEAKTAGVGTFVAHKQVDSVISVDRHSERIVVLKMVLGDRLLNVFMVYAPHSENLDEEKECFWNDFEYGSWNADGSRILEFADGLNVVICNTLFMK